ncbi:efflux RND transporter periplasmic adaptor subunit [Arcobacter caeni]|uniref:HlyD family secretion protein n=1 Tax=Arcobacter caeni TaxID=1912877 RepID=A0A363CY75_9BACT|nr:efflux RND transporter periplasmic adaptor subunit [Arcobacter caeni]PUE64060.1 HlyD family secretion protein [Arcobacter caeni]
MKKILILTLFIFQALFAEEIYATFDVVSEKKSELGLSVSGIISTLNVNVGDKVKKGDLLLSLNNSQEKVEYETARKNAEHSAKIYERYAKISDVIDKEKMENYLYDRDITQLNAQNKEIVLRKTELRAPYDLVVSKKNIDLGSIVLASQTKLIDVIALDDVKLVLKFDEKYWQKLKIGQLFTYKVDGSDKIYEGKISKIYPTILNETREMQAEVKTKDLMPGLFGNGTIKAE